MDTSTLSSNQLLATRERFEQRREAREEAVGRIEEKTGLSFGALSRFDPIEEGSGGAVERLERLLRERAVGGSKGQDGQGLRVIVRALAQQQGALASPEDALL